MSFSIVQTINGILQWGYGHSVTYTSAVNAGDFLYLVASSYAYQTSAGVITDIEDNINGSWTILDNTGSVLNNSSYDVTGVFAYCANTAAAAANALTVTINGGTQDFDVVAVELSGAATSSPIIGHATNTALLTTSFATPNVTDTAAGDFVIGWVSGTSGSGPFSAGSGATLDSNYNGANNGYVGLLHLTANSSASSNSVNVSQSGNNSTVGGTVIVSQIPPSNFFNSSWQTWHAS